MSTSISPDPQYEPLPVAGYKPQGAAPISQVNDMKFHEEKLLRVLDDMKLSGTVDLRWLAIGRTHLEQAFMAINRSIFQPDRIDLPGDGK